MSFRLAAPRLRGLAVGAAASIALFATPAAAQDEPTVTMPQFTFAPTEVHIAPGGSVNWINDSVVAHTVTADDGSFDAGLVDPGATWSMTFDTPGTYPYYCVPHGSPGGHGMAAVIIVDEPGA